MVVWNIKKIYIIFENENIKWIGNLKKELKFQILISLNSFVKEVLNEHAPKIKVRTVFSEHYRRIMIYFPKGFNEEFSNKELQRIINNDYYASMNYEENNNIVFKIKCKVEKICC